MSPHPFLPLHKGVKKDFKVLLEDELLASLPHPQFVTRAQWWLPLCLEKTAVTGRWRKYQQCWEKEQQEGKFSVTGCVAKWRQIFSCWHDTGSALGLGVLCRKELGSPPAAPLLLVWLISTRKTLANPLPLPAIISIEVKDQNPKPKHVERLVFSASEKKVCVALQTACFPVWACCIIRVYTAAFIRVSLHTLQTSHSLTLAGRNRWTFSVSHQAEEWRTGEIQGFVQDHIQARTLWREHLTKIMWMHRKKSKLHSLSDSHGRP